MVFKPFTLGQDLVAAENSVVENKVPFNEIAKWTKTVITKRLKGYSGIGSQKLQNVV